MSDAPLPLPPSAPPPHTIGGDAALATAAAAEARVRASAGRALEAASRAHGLAEQSGRAMARARLALDERDALLADARTTRAALCDAVGALAARLRRDGVPPERMLVAVKAAVRGAAPAGTDPGAAQELMGDAVRSGIGAYYAAA